MHGLGNDYVYIDCFQAPNAAFIAQVDIPALARRVSDRHIGVGSDGLVLIMPSDKADLRMRIFNADGSEARMCGNAARCIAKYAFEQGICGERMSLETMSGIKRLVVDAQSGLVTVEMGTSIGNPHKVFIMDEPVETLAIYGIEDTNVEWINVLNKHEIMMRVWERGSEETMACGTGACASAIAAMDRGLTETEVTVHMPGGDVMVRRDEKGVIYLIGPATEVFRGEYIGEEKGCDQTPICNN